MQQMNTKVTLCGLELDNPVIPASGTFGYGYEFAEIYDINCLGTFSFKGTTRDPRFGNPTPRIAECPAGLINSVGLQNPGVEAVIARELPKLKEVFQLDEKRPIRRLSKGMQKQAAFWLALCCMPDYLILDEPVDGLDPVMRRQVWSLVLADVAQRGTTVLVSSHNLRELEDVCDHVGIMDHGKVLLERSLAQLQDNMVKLQVVFPDGVTEVPADLPVLHASRIGRIHTLIMRMNAQEAEDLLAAYSPLLVDAVPLTLEEIFIYELGGADYAVKDIVL